MSRLPVLAPGDLDADQDALYRAITGGPRAAGPQLFALTDAAGGLHGPFNAMLFAPPLGQAQQALGAAVRYRTTLTDRVRELATLLVAARWHCAFEQYAHEPLGRAAGWTPAELATVRDGGAPPGADEPEAAALELVRVLLDAQDVDDATYDRAVAILGHRAVVELTALVGYYCTLALQLRVFRVPVPTPAESDPS